jgi:hypothetical protein
MTEATITLELTRSEALALDALVNNAAEKLFMIKGGKDDYAFESWSMETAATACDKLHAAVMPSNYPETSTWKYCLSQTDYE